MRQWNKNNRNDILIDSRTEQELLDRIEELSESYVPEWKFDRKNPDIGSVISLIYARQMMDNIDKYNGTLEQFQIGFLNMLGVSLRPAIPASAMVTMKLAEDSLAGIPVEKGVKLLAAGEDEQPIVFETESQIYVTAAKLVRMFMTSAATGKVIPLLGGFQAPYYLDPAEPEEYTRYPFGLFDFRESGYERHGLLLYHTHLFDVENSDIILEFGDSPLFQTGVEEQQYRFSYYGEDGFAEFDQVYPGADGRIRLQKHLPCGKVERQGEAYSVILIEAKGNPVQTVMLEDIRISSVGEPVYPEFVTTGSLDLDVQRFRPFGDTLALYKEVYIGENAYFHKPGAQITIRFRVDLETNQVLLTKREEEESLKVIKRKPKVLVTEVMSETYVDEVSLEYFNGTGWKRLDCGKSYGQMFANPNGMDYELSFRCPEDWEEQVVGGDSGRCIRMQILKADNCYLRPCTHYYPVVSDLQISYTYDGQIARPQCLERIAGTERTELTGKLQQGQAVSAFTRGRYTDTALYMGFDKKMQDGPISMLFELEEDGNFQGAKLNYYYSGPKGFQRLKLVDYTNGMTNTNRIVFLPPPDMMPMELEGYHGYWIKLVDEENRLDQTGVFRPKIKNIYMNTVEVSNTETLPEEEYYIDEVEPDMAFRLYADNVLAVDVWVNETLSLTEGVRNRLLAECPDRVRMETDTQGVLSRFFVKWEEVDNFDCSTSGDRHYCVDRLNNRLIFGDGVHVQIPRNTVDAAFLVQITRCGGAEGNLEPDQINASMSRLLFIQDIRNPMKSYGGSDMETTEEALHRGGNLISSRHRLVSSTDYEREVLGYSKNVVQVKTVIGYTKEYRQDEQAITLVVLLQDYLSNPQSFYHIQGPLKQHLLSQCELSVNPDKLMLVPPLMVAVSVELWVELFHIEETFELQNYYQSWLAEYLDPYSAQAWEIGSMPTEAQIRLLLRSGRHQIVIRHISIHTVYQDESGLHEQSLEDLKVTPYMLCKSGTHKIHFVQK